MEKRLYPAAFVGLALIVACVLSPNAPVLRTTPYRDSGVFLYIGQQILRGDVPYRDVWDHKPPAIYYIDALGLLVANGSVWGVWALEFLALYAAALLGFILVKGAFGTPAAIFASVGWMAGSILLLEGGNLTEEFALPLQFLAMYAFFIAHKRGCSPWWAWPVVGLAGTAAFLLKPSLVGVWLSIAVVLPLTVPPSQRWRGLVQRYAAMLGAALGLVAVVVAYLALRQALKPGLDAVLAYNYSYSASTIAHRLRAVKDGLSALSPSGISLLALAAWATGIWALFRCRQDIPEAGKPLLYLSLVDLPAEFALAALSGRSYAHYYLAWLPGCAILLGFFASSLLPESRSGYAQASPHSPRAALSGVSLLALLGAMSCLPMAALRTAMIDSARQENALAPVRQFIQSATTSADYVLLWGAEAGVNFAADRRSPSRYAYQYPLYQRGYQDPQIIRQFLADIIRNRPALIIDTSATSGIIPPIDATERAGWVSSNSAYCMLPEMQEVFSYLAANYTYVGTVGEMRWAVYGPRTGSEAYWPAREQGARASTRPGSIAHPVPYATAHHTCLRQGDLQAIGSCGSPPNAELAHTHPARD